MVYPDASVLIAALLGEPMTEPARALLRGKHPLAASQWLLTEVASGLGTKERRRLIRPPTRTRAFAACKRLMEESARMLPLGDADCVRAADLIGRSTLRAGDALQLAIAERHGAIVWTLDQSMAEAGQALGLGTQLLS